MLLLYTIIINNLSRVEPDYLHNNKFSARNKILIYGSFRINYKVREVSISFKNCKEIKIVEE